MDDRTDTSPRPGWRTALGGSREERLRTIGLFALFFLVIAAFWVQKPIRTSRFLTSVGPEYLPLVKLGTAFLVLPVVLFYSSLAARFRRESLVYLCVGAFVTASLVFWWLLSARSGGSWSAYAYFFYVDIFNSVMVALFWSLANDLNSPEEAQRTYGVIGAGGIVGGAVGSAVTGWSVEHVGTANMLLICVGILLAIAVIARWISHLKVDAAAKQRTPGGTAQRSSWHEAVAGARLTLTSPYLAAIAMLVVGYEIVSNVIDYQFNTLVAAAYQTDGAMASFLGRLSTASNVAALIVQLVVTTWILRHWGPRVGLLVLPIALALGSAGFAFVPILTIVTATFVSDAALGYSLNQTTKEVLYTPTDSATKYQAKAFIDVFLMRLAKGVSSLLILGCVAWLGQSTGTLQWLAVLSLAVVAAWLAVAYFAGRAYARRVEAGEPRAAVAGDASGTPATAKPAALLPSVG
jgi:ATP:ADP antiporter, AAA family